MELSTSVWITLIVGVVIVVVLALVLGRGLTIKKTQNGMRVDVKEKATDQPVSVAEKLSMEGGEAGNIVGVEGPSGGNDPSIDVAREARLKNAKVGDIVGRRDPSASSGEDPEEQQ